MKSKPYSLIAAMLFLCVAPEVASAQGSLFDTYMVAAVNCIKEKRFAAAEVFARACVKEAEELDSKSPQRSDPEHADPRLVMSLQMLGLVYYDEGKRENLKDLFADKRKSRIDLKVLGPGLLPFASQLYRLGDTYYDQAYEAERKIDPAKGKDDPANKAFEEQAKIKFTLAMRMLLASTMIRKEKLEPAHPDLAMSLNLLGVLHRKLEEDEYISTYERAIKALEAQTAAAVALNKNGYRYSVSKPAGDISVSPQVETLGSMWLKVFLARDLIYRSEEGEKKDDTAKRLSKAERTLKQLLEEWEEWPEHENVEIILNNLGLLYFEQERYDDAESMYKRSLVILEKIKPPTHAAIASVRRNYAKVLRKRAELSRKAGRETEARQYEDRARALSNGDK